MTDGRRAVRVRFWAGARRAAGQAEQTLTGATVGEVLDQLARRRDLAVVLASASFLVDGVRADRATPIPAGATLEVLPPFAGG